MSQQGEGLSERHKKIISILECNFKYLVSLGVDPGTLRDYKALLSSLHSMHLGQLSDMYLNTGKMRGGKSARPQLPDVGALTLEEIRSKLASPKVSRDLLEKIARDRFGLSKGAVSSLRNKEALIDKLESSLSNEASHDVIAKVVVSSASNKETDS
ncbi:MULTISPECIES: hypothetical protein [Pseudomonas]|uniref:hypothetical protein n=1 Tax=Pseudomonas TaxID=286 RepID=UPI0012E08272|nr:MULTISPECIES: hypothetical protein [Pseudomonas]